MNQPLRHIAVYFLTGLFLFTSLRAAYGKICDTTDFDIVQSAEKEASGWFFFNTFFEEIEENSEDEKSDEKHDSNTSHSTHLTEVASSTHHSLYNSSAPIVRLSRLFILFHRLKTAPF